MTVTNIKKRKEIIKQQLCLKTRQTEKETKKKAEEERGTQRESLTDRQTNCYILRLRTSLRKSISKNEQQNYKTRVETCAK